MTRYLGEFNLLGEPSVITSLAPFWGIGRTPARPLLSRTVTNYRIGERHGGPQTVVAAATAMSLN